MKRTYKISELSTLLKRGITPSYTETPKVMVINQKCIRNYKLNLDLVRYTDPEKKKVADEKYLKSFDILVNSTGVGTLGRVAQIYEVTRPVTADSHVTIVRPDNKTVDPLYFGYCLKSRQKHIESLGEGSTGQTELSRVLLGDMEIEILENFREQKIVASFLKAIDEKIELNQKMNATLEEIAKTLFKSWFIDFDPVRAKAEGSSTGLSKEISDLFPDTFESSEIGEIPKGWHVGNIEDIAEKVSDKYKREEDWSNEKLIDLSRMPSNSIALNSHGKGEELSTSVCKFQKYDFLFGSIRPYFYKAGVCPFNGVSNTSVFILRAKNDFDREFMYFYSSSEKTFERSVQYSDGTKMPIIKWNDFKEFKFALPNKELRKNFSSITRPIVDKIILNIEEQETLSNLRDSLLPKLIAGEIKIPDVEELIEEVSIK